MTKFTKQDDRVLLYHWDKTDINNISNMLKKPVKQIKIRHQELVSPRKYYSKSKENKNIKNDRK